MAWVSRFRIRRAADALRRGEIVAYPTEAVYGLGCDPFDAHAVQSLLRLKRRPEAKGLILIAADLEAVERLVDLAAVRLRQEILATWPGPVTWVIPARPEVPRWLRGVHDSLALRVTAHPVAAALCRAFGGAIVSTSANRSGRRPIRSPLRLRREFSRDKVHFVPGKLSDERQPTRIYEAGSGRRLR
jgi:L-threonylcarbamoyladenylate synthase